jgi:hypothetical protein
MKTRLHRVLCYAPILILFSIGIYFAVLRPMEPHFSGLPGDITDARLNNYILEHDYRWLSGLESSLWDVPYYYPYSATLTFSDSHLGSMFFYAPFRWLGMDRETAFQAWFILGYILNFGGVVFVLKHLKLKPLAIGAGAFLFAFGLPVLGQEGHAQLVYRFCIPLACYALWQFAQERDFRWLFFALLGVVWQYNINIYMGSFLLLLLFVQILIFPFLQHTPFFVSLAYWPNIFKRAWQKAGVRDLALWIVLILSQLLELGYLFNRYSSAFKLYGFTRPWLEVAPFLPRIQNYLISDNSKIWHFLSDLLPPILLNRGEQGLFVGGAVIILMIIGLTWRFPSQNRKLMFLCFLSAGLMVILTMYIKGFSIYEILWRIPGFNGMRAISRVILVILWPISVITAIVLDALLQPSKKAIRLFLIALTLTGILISESIFFEHSTFTKQETKARIQKLRAQLPASVPDNPILFVSYSEPEDWVASEIDAMLLSQDLGWPVMNGYSAYNPPGYGPTLNCDQAAIRVTSYMPIIRSSDPLYFGDIYRRIVFINNGYCDPKWLEYIPSISEYSGPFPQEIFSGISLTIQSVKKVGDHLVIQVDIDNNSSFDLPTFSLTNNRFRLAWQMVDVTQQTPPTGFNTRKEVAYDVPAGGHALVTIIANPPYEEGQYYIEVSAVQESVAWFHDRGMQPVISTQIIHVTENHRWFIVNSQ